MKCLCSLVWHRAEETMKLLLYQESHTQMKSLNRMTWILRSSSASLKSTFDANKSFDAKKWHPKKVRAVPKTLRPSTRMWIFKNILRALFFMCRTEQKPKKIKWKNLYKPVNEMAVVSGVLRQVHWLPVKTPPMLATVNAPIHTQNLPLLLLLLFFFFIDIFAPPNYLRCDAKVFVDSISVT